MVASRRDTNIYYYPLDKILWSLYQSLDGWWSN